MPLSREQFSTLLNSCVDVNERLLALIVKDLEGQNVQLARIYTSDVDQVSRLIRVHVEGGTSQSVKLSKDTVETFRDYIATRKDRDPCLFLSSSGRPMGESEIRSWARMLGARSGMEFDESRLIFQSRKPSETSVGRLVQKGASRDIFYLYGVVAHPLRRKIVELLGDEGPLGFTQIKSRLNIRVGTLYYHFDILSGLIVQDEQKRYMLTAAGRDAYDKLHSEEYVRSEAKLSDSAPVSAGLLARLGKFFALRWLITLLQSESILAFVTTGFVLALGLIFVSEAQLETVVLFLNPTYNGPPILALEFLGSWLGVYGISDLIATYLFGRKGEHLPLLLGTTYAMVPLILFAGWWTYVADFTITVGGLGTFAFSRVVLILLQAFSLLLLARMVSGLKGLRLDKAAVISLTVAYLSITIAYFRGG